MAFVVHSVSGLPTAPKARLLDSVSYPSYEVPDKILTKITLWEVEANVGGMLTWSYWKSVFNWRPDYNVIVHQKDPIKDKTYTFVVHETENLEVANAAFKSVCETLEPLVDDCAVIFTKPLLEGIVTPMPKKTAELPLALTDLMIVNPDAHSDWATVLRALWRKPLVHDDVDSIAGLAEQGGGVHQQDNEGNTFLHRAVTAGSAKGVEIIIEIISETEKQKLVKATNKHGKAAIHSAFEHNNPDIVRILVQSGADLTMAANDDDGSNPFHLAAQNDSAKCIQAVHHISAAEHQKIQKALDAPNKTGFTPLMFSVKGGFIDSAVSLLQADANPNVQHAESGNTALHFAAEKGDAVVLKALIVFGGDIFIRNKGGKTPLDVALGATEGDHKGCIKILQEITDLTKQANDIYASAQKLPDVASDSVFLLCLDGGGVRGLLGLQILIAIRNRMKQIQPDCAPLHDYFDYIAGTSIGGVFTLAASAMNAGLEESRADLFKVVDNIFTSKPTFSSADADGIAKGTFGVEMNISDITKPRIIIHTVEAHANPPVLRKLCNFGKNKSDWKVWEAARATTAAPIYFPPHKECYIDGGVMANNPTLSAMAEIVEAAAMEETPCKFGMVVSIGTGRHKVPQHLDHIGVYVPTICNLNTIPHSLSALGNLMNLFIGQSTTSDGEIVAQARSWCNSVGAQYFRLSPELSVPIDLAESKKVPIVEMMYEGLEFGLQSARDIDMIARVLLSKKLAIC
ncbi:hypothetical protein EMCRGX_G029151 [Ephydatia muelleri]